MNPWIINYNNNENFQSIQVIKLENQKFFYWFSQLLGSTYNQIVNSGAFDENKWIHFQKFKPYIKYCIIKYYINQWSLLYNAIEYLWEYVF
jgi:hypothetical protein